MRNSLAGTNICGRGGRHRSIDGGTARPANPGILFVREGDLLVCIYFLSFFDMHWAAGMQLPFVSCGLHYVGTVLCVRQCCMRFLVLSSSGPALD